MATIIKRRRADGHITYRVQDRTSGYPSLSHSFDTLALARRFKLKVEHERNEGLAGLSRGRHRLSEAVDAYLETDGFRGRKAGKDTKRHLAWWVDRLGNLPLSSITPELIGDHLHKLEANGASGATVNRYRSALSGAFRYASEDRHWIDRNPCRQTRHRREGRPRHRTITSTEWVALLTACEKLAQNAAPSSPRRQVGEFLRLLYATGARRSEVRSLRWEYVDLKAGRVTFPDTKNGEARVVPIIGDGLAALQQQERLKRNGNQWVFPGVRCETPADFDATFREARKLAGLDRPDTRGEMLVQHSLRHSAATEAGRHGATAFEIAALTGHKTLAMVQRYTKTDETHALAALTKRARA